MLLAHVFADVVAWLHFYDLDALLLTNARCSELAHSAVSKLRVFDFSELQLAVYREEVYIYKIRNRIPSHVTVLKFLDEGDLVAFIPAAMRNCVLGNLASFVKGSLDAMKAVAQTVVVTGTLYLYAPTFANADDLAKFADSFRNVKNVTVSTLRAFNDSYAEELVNLFDRHGFMQEQVYQYNNRVSFVRRSV